MRQWTRTPPWISHVAVGLGYFLAYQLLREVSVSHWALQAGLRLGCVLLLPRKYWPVLVLAEVSAQVPLSYQYGSQYGWPWSLSHLFPAILFAMLPVALLRKYLPATTSGTPASSMTAKRMTAVLVCAFILALLSAIDGAIQFILTNKPSSYAIPPLGAVTGRYLLGHYLGSLMLVPLALMVHEVIHTSGPSWKRRARQLVKNRMLWEGLVLGALSFALLTALGMSSANDTTRQIARLGMFLPAAWLALRYGWRGAAIGGAATSVGIALSMPAVLDPLTVLAHTYMAFTVTALLPLGAHIDALHGQERSMGRAYRRAQQVARQEVYQCELRLRRMSEVLERSHGELQLSHGRLLHKLRFMLSAGESMVYREELQAIRQKIYRVIDSLSPRDWQKHDLPGALWNGPITQALDDAGITYYVRDPEGSLGQLPADVRLTLFRLACEAVAYLLARGCITTVRLRLRGGQNHSGRGWAVLIVYGEYEKDDSLDTPVLPTQEQVQAWLGVSGLDLKGMRDRASLYDGNVHSHVTLERGRVSMLLQDTGNIPQEEEAVSRAMKD